MAGKKKYFFAFGVQQLANGIGNIFFGGAVGYLPVSLIFQQDIAGQTVTRLLGFQRLPFGVDNIDRNQAVLIMVVIE